MEKVDEKIMNERWKVYRFLEDICFGICSEAFKKQYDMHFKNCIRDPNLPYWKQGFHFTPPKEAVFITRELLPSAKKGEITMEEVTEYKESLEGKNVLELF